MQPRPILRDFLLFNIAILLFASHYASAQAGELDNTFATGGIFTAPSSKSVENAVAIQSDGKIVVAGIGVTNGAFADVLFRLNTDGTLDPTFGSGGVVSVSPPGSVEDNGFFGVAIQSDGKIVAAAAALTTVQVVRVQPNGALDTSFGNGGLTSSVFVPDGISSGGLALQGNGDILMVAGALNPSLMVRFTSTGKLDTFFGTGGQVNLQFGGPTQVAVQANGKILVTSGEAGRLAKFAYPFAQAGSVTRYYPNGILDTTFGAAGTAASVTSASALLVQGDGKIVVAGPITSKVNAPQTANDVGFGVVRFNPGGGLDGTFGKGGVAITDFGSSANDSGAFAVALQSNGDIVATGAAGNLSQATFTNSSFGLSRYTSTGQLDTTFGVGGITITTIASGQISWVDAMAIQSDGKIVVAGTSIFDIDFENGYVARYLAQ
jgi:uncharacterized delta-60 repeat protein